MDNHLDVDKELFLWSVITGRREFNLLFWSRGKNKICKLETNLNILFIWKTQSKQIDVDSFDIIKIYQKKTAIKMLKFFIFDY